MYYCGCENFDLCILAPSYTYVVLRGSSNRVEILITISHGAVWRGVFKSFGQISPFGDESDFALSHCIRVRVLQNREFIRRNGIFGDDEFCGSSRGPPRNFYSLLPQLFFLRIARTGVKTGKFCRHVSFKNYRPSLSTFATKKKIPHALAGILLHRTSVQGLNQSHAEQS